MVYALSRDGERANVQIYFPLLAFTMETYDNHKRYARSRVKKYDHDHYHSKDHNKLSFPLHDLQLEQHDEEQQRHHCRHHNCHRQHRSKSKVSTSRATTCTVFVLRILRTQANLISQSLFVRTIIQCTTLVWY